jgi:hypothetical protein
MSFVVGELYKIKEEYKWINPFLYKPFLILSVITTHKSYEVVTYFCNSKIYTNKLAYIFYENVK